MGSGESTTRRISMQRSDEGTIQITENVMNRLRKGSISENESSHTYDEDKVKEMLQEAYLEGRVAEHESALKEMRMLEEDFEDDRKEMIDDHKEKLKEMENVWRKKVENLTEQTSNDKTESDIKDAANRLAEERKTFESQLLNREKLLQEEFNKGIATVQEKLNPMKENSICSDKRSFVMECYKENRSKPLRCSNEVENFVRCVQEERLKRLQQNFTKAAS